MWGDPFFFPAFNELYQLMKHSGKHEHKAALGQRGGGGSPGCFFQRVLTASFSKLLDLTRLFVTEVLLYKAPTLFSLKQAFLQSDQ